MPIVLTHAIQQEVEALVRHSTNQQIIKGKGYLYFSISSSQEEISIKPLCHKGGVFCYQVLNFKQIPIGYLVLIKQSPKVVILEFGAGIYYAKRKNYDKIKVEFADQKFRFVSFDAKDYFVSVKWKSNNVSE